MMDTKADSKRKKGNDGDNKDRRKEKKSRRQRSRSSSIEDRENRRKRKHSRSKSPNVPSKQDKRQYDANKEADIKKEVPVKKAKETDMLNTRTGGAYIPPARLRMMQAQITDKSSAAYQRLAWEALKKSIHGHINKINVGNIGIIIKELLKENIVRGRGLLCRSVIQAQAASPTFTNVYAALVAAVNSRFPNIGELLLKRLVIQFKRGFKRNDKSVCISSASFIAHLVNQRVAHEILALELLTLLVESPTDDSVEVAIAFLKECGQKLTEVSSKGVNAIFEMLRNILHEGQLDKRVQYMIEVMFQVWKDGFKDHPALIEELELVPEEEQFTHLLMLDDATDPQDILNVFKFDDKFEDNEQKYKTLSKEILGSDAESGEEDGSEESGSEESDDEQEQEGEQKGMTIIDNTETNLVALRRTIYLTINSSLDFEECAHKLMKMQLKPGQEVELCHMFLDCCAEQRTYEKFYGLLAQRFCNINRMYIGPFEEIFKDSYATAHRLDTNRLRNVSKFFAHLLFTDSISWEVMECVKLNEEDTTSSSRIYIKILYQELAEYMGLKKLNDRLKDPTLQVAFSGIFPRDNPKNTRFSINFFTSIGLGGLTDELREHLKQMPKNVPAPVTDINVESESSSDSSSSSSSSDSSDSSSSDDEKGNKKNKKQKKSKEKDKSKEKNDSVVEDTSNKEASSIEKDRWGHDGFYNTYGDNARRHENRSDRSEQKRSNFAKPRDVPRRTDNRERRNTDDREENQRRETDIRSVKEHRMDGAEDRRNERNARNDRYENEKHPRDRSNRDDYDARKNRDEDRLDKDDYDARKNRDADRLNRDDYDARKKRDGDRLVRDDIETRRTRGGDRLDKRRNKAEDPYNKSNRNNDDKNRDRNSERDTKDKSSDQSDGERRNRFEESRSNRHSDRDRDRNTEKEKSDNNKNEREQRQSRSESHNYQYNRHDDERSRDRNGDKGRNDKDTDGNNRGKDIEDSNRKTRDKTMKRNENQSGIEKTHKQEKTSKHTSKREKYNDSSDEDDSSSRVAKGRSNNKKKGGESKDDRKKNKNDSKRDKKRRDVYSSDESESKSDCSDNDHKNSGRYWDTFDIGNRESIQENTKLDKRSSKSKGSEKRRER